MKPKLKFLLDYQCSCLWAADENTRKHFGDNITDLKALGLSPDTIKICDELVWLYSSRLNPIHPLLPSLWSGAMHRYFRNLLIKTYKRMMDELGADYELINEEIEEMLETTSEEEWDNQLRQFLDVPEKFCREAGIHFSTVRELRQEVKLAYENWKRKEDEISIFRYQSSLTIIISHSVSFMTFTTPPKS